MTGRVLIVDDSLTVRMDLTEAFEAGGLDTVPCATAAEARLVLSGDADPVDAIVLDVQLPDADGVEFLRELRTSTRHEATPVLMLSSEAAVTDRLRGLRTGADEYVGKPYDAGYVVARARQLIGRPATGTASPVTTVLLIDDSPTLREEMRGALEQQGYAVVTAASGEDGLRIAADRRPGVIIVDGFLPGVDGATVIRRVRQDSALRDVPCVLLTGATDRAFELDVLDAGADAFISKNEDVAVLLAKVAAVLRRDTGTADRDHPTSLNAPKKILAVDADATYLETLTTCLREDGYDIAKAGSGEEALALLNAQPVDCIVLDPTLPGIDGHETCRRIKAAPALRDIPLIIVSSRDDPATMVAGLADGADDYAAKSDQFDILRARVRAQLRRKHFQDESRRANDDRLRQELSAAETRAAQELARIRATLIDELEWKNSELEAFSYSVSHDLRNPLNVVNGFSEALLEDYGNELGETGAGYVHSIRRAAARMEDFIEALLRLSHAGRADITRQRVDVTAVAAQAADMLRAREPDRPVEIAVQDGMTADADADLLHVVLENLIGNAWKYTRRTASPRIEVGRTGSAFFVRDNGAGFSMANAGTLFQPYGRLHDDSDFPGTGIGLATVHRIVGRHGGRIWAEGRIGDGATFFFTTEPGAEPGAEPPA